MHQRAFLADISGTYGRTPESIYSDGRGAAGCPAGADRSRSCRR